MSRAANTPGETGGRAGGPAPAALSLTAVLVALQGAGLLALAAFYAVELVVATADDPQGAGVFAVMAALAGGSLLLVARALLRRRRWARSPALVTQLLVVPGAAGLLPGSRWFVGAVALIWALGLIVLLLSPLVGGSLDAAPPTPR